ncbi:LPXTG cell wall anchor domain-containing protein [Streptomyces sp. CWNU-52B]|uniref:LPXTG cell wall anchor domain-containing protein n=1 Tax=unclassified Streptomyces TaxID=2593676 RepID=UPI0039C4A7AD
MTKKTRIRVARIAAGAVIAAGASLTAAGAASALDINANVAGVELGVGINVADDDPTDDPTIPTDPTDDPTVIPTDPTDDPTEPTEEPTEPTEEPTEPTEEPTDGPTDDPTDAPSTPGDDNNGGGSGGNNNNPDGGGSNPVEQGEGKESLTDTGSDTSAQGTGGELAETGAAENITYLLIGAATMIAGGIGFRMLPRLMNGRGAAA